MQVVEVVEGHAAPRPQTAQDGAAIGSRAVLPPSARGVAGKPKDTGTTTRAEYGWGRPPPHGGC